ncbi:MAG: GDSL-type esterase/lipase family protein [Bacteroidales bacterium]
MRPVKVLKKAMIILFVTGMPVLLSAQVNPFDIKKFEFIDYDENSFIMNDHQKSKAFFEKMDSLILLGKGKINILHIGDSHIQADYVSGQLRKRFQNMAWGLNGGRGFVFPVKMAGSNNPWNFSLSYTGSWDACKNVEEKRDCPIGLGGYIVSTTSEKAGLSINYREKNYLPYTHKKVRVYHNMDTANWRLAMKDTSLSYKLTHRMDSAYSVFEFDTCQHDFSMEVHRKTDAGEFILRGVSFENEDPGIVYHSVGVNGAEVESWLRCPLMMQDIQSIEPDFIIVSLGTNDSYTSKFDKLEFENNMRRFLDRLKKTAPGTALLWVTPGDNYRYRKYLNYNTEKATEVILKLGREYHFMVWDFYDIMGELNAIMSWYYAGLTARDKLHYNKKGYELQGDLMFNAFLRAYNQHIDQKAKLQE